MGEAEGGPGNKSEMVIIISDPGVLLQRVLFIHTVNIISHNDEFSLRAAAASRRVHPAVSTEIHPFSAGPLCTAGSWCRKRPRQTPQMSSHLKTQNRTKLIAFVVM